MRLQVRLYTIQCVASTQINTVLATIGKCTCKYMYESDLYVRTVESCNSFLYASTEQNRGEG